MNLGRDIIFSSKYSLNRSREGSESYGLRCRTEEVARVLDRHREIKVVVDLGAADGRMISRLGDLRADCEFFGVEYNWGLARAGRANAVKVLQGDIQTLGIRSGSIDAALMCSTFKHMRYPQRALEEIRRILRVGGLLVLSDPRPLAVRIGIWRGYFDKRFIYNLWTVESISPLLKSLHFEILSARHFMQVPIPARLGKAIDLINKALRTSFGLSSQMVVCRKAG